MKILHLLDERWDSGLTQYAVQICELLQRAGHDVRLGVLSDKRPREIAMARGIKTEKIDSLFDLRRLTRVERWDVINVHTGRMHTWALLLAPARTPIVRTRGDARPVQNNMASRFVYRRTAAVIAASAHIARFYEDDLGLPESKVHVIYPSVQADAEVTRPAQDRVGILGRLDPVKGHAVFLEAVADVVKERPQTKFIIAGKEANVRFDLLANQIRELGIESAVQYVGFQPSAQDFMRGCSIGVIASIGSEEISRACLEWMGVGRPVVGTLVGCLPELIEPNENGLLVAPGDGLAMGDALLKLLREPDRINAMGRNANTLMKSKFAAESFLKKTVEVYESVANRPR